MADGKMVYQKLFEGLVIPFGANVAGNPTDPKDEAQLYPVGAKKLPDVTPSMREEDGQVAYLLVVGWDDIQNCESFADIQTKSLKSPEVIVEKNERVHHFPSKDCSLRQSGQTQSRSHLKNCVTDEGNHAEGNFEAGLVDEHHADGNLDATQEKDPNKELPHGDGDFWSKSDDNIHHHHASFSFFFIFSTRVLPITTEIHRSVTATQDSSRKC